MFDQLGRIDVRHEDRRHERLVNTLHQVRRTLAAATDDDAIGLHQIRHRTAFAKELGIRHNVERRVLIIPLNRCGDPLAGLHGDGRFIHNHTILAGLERRGDLAGHAFNERHVHRAVRLRRCGHCDENHLRCVHSFVNAVGETEASGGNISSHEFLEPRLVNRDFSRLKHVHFTLVVIDADDRVAYFSEASSCDEAHVTGADNAEFHFLYFLNRFRFPMH